MPTTTVSETEYQDRHGNTQTQYKTTIPKGLAEALELGGCKITWTVVSANTLQARVVE